MKFAAKRLAIAICAASLALSFACARLTKIVSKPASATSASDSRALTDKPLPSEALQILKDGNARFVTGKSARPHTDIGRVHLAGKADQANHAYATVISCSDSRVPVEHIFDAGVMDIFIVRVAGNIAGPDTIGSIEYGLRHVNTPVLVVLGHTQCGAVKAAVASAQGGGHALERNIPVLITRIAPAVRRALSLHSSEPAEKLADYAAEENVWQVIEDLLRESPATRELLAAEKIKVVGAIYDVGAGKVRWLPEDMSQRILIESQNDPTAPREPMAEHTGEHGHSAPGEIKKDENAPTPHSEDPKHPSVLEPKTKALHLPLPRLQTH